MCRISGDGLRVVLYKPVTTEVGSQPPPLPSRGADSIYSYENLPACHHRKYMYAYRFVQLVQAKTPKLTLYTQRSKCVFMENGPQPDCEVHFYNGVQVRTAINSLIFIYHICIFIHFYVLCMYIHSLIFIYYIYISFIILYVYCHKRI